MAPKLYAMDISPAVRSVLLVSKAIGLELEIIPVNLATGEHMTPEYLKLNPQHTVPTLDDDGFVVWDSHAIGTYLVQKYGHDDSLYPKDLQKRAVVDQRLHFDSGILFPRLGAMVGPILREGAKSVPKEKADLVVQAYQFLETFLERTTYMAGEHLTIADLSCFSTVTSLNVLVPMASNRFPKISEWLSKMQALPYAQANQTGLDKFAGFLKSKLA